MTIKAVVTAEEKSQIEAKAKANGQSVSGYLKTAALGDSEKISTLTALQKCAEAVSVASQSIRDIATHTIAYKSICGTELRQMLAAFARMESEMADILRSTTDSVTRR